MWEIKRQKGDCGGELLLVWLDAELSLAWKLMKRLISSHVGSFVLGNKRHITRQTFTTARHKTLGWCMMLLCVCVCVCVVNYMNLLLPCVANETAKTQLNSGCRLITCLHWIYSCRHSCCSYPAGDLGGALVPSGPWPDLGCMVMASIFTTGAGPRPGTHSDTPSLLFVSYLCKLNTPLDLTH